MLLVPLLPRPKIHSFLFSYAPDHAKNIATAEVVVAAAAAANIPPETVFILCTDAMTRGFRITNSSAILPTLRMVEAAVATWPVAEEKAEE